MKRLLVLIMLFFQSCGNKFIMSNMLGDDNVDVSSFVRNGYKPVYCDGKIYKLINSKPYFTLENDFKFLDKEIKGWLKENGYNEEYHIVDSINGISYRYSYLLSYYPIDVYTVQIIILNGISSKELFFRKDKDTLISSINTSGWIFSKCDK
jgi:hypothetical protein